jgi:hypothetical protein
MYIEDDILVPSKAIKYWLEYNEKLIEYNCNLGFVRIEVDNNIEYITDLPAVKFEYQNTDYIWADLLNLPHSPSVDFFNLIRELDVRDSYSRFNTELQKPYLINRLIDPSKVDANKERVDFLFKLISEGFFTAEQVRDQIELEYKDKPEKKGKFVVLYREITLKELGI